MVSLTGMHLEDKELMAPKKNVVAPTEVWRDAYCFVCHRHLMIYTLTSKRVDMHLSVKWKATSRTCPEHSEWKQLETKMCPSCKAL